MLRDPHHGDVVGVRSCREVNELDLELVDGEIHAALEGHGRRRQAQLAPLDRFEEALLVPWACPQHLVATSDVSYHSCIRQQAVAVCVVAVVMGVHHQARDLAGYLLDLGKVSVGATLGGAGVDTEDRTSPGEEAGVVDPAAPFGLDVSEDAVGDLGQRRS